MTAFLSMIRHKLEQAAWSIYGHLAWDKNQHSSAAKNLSERLIEILSQHKNSNQASVLDVGCGTGYFGLQLARAGFKVIGVDYASGMINKAKASYGAFPNLQFKQADLSKGLAFQSNTFHHAICISSIQALPDAVAALKEINRLVKPGGLILISHTSKPEFHQSPIKDQVQQQLQNSKKKTLLSAMLLYAKTYAERNGFSNYWTPEELRQIIKRSGLNILAEENIDKKILISSTAIDPQL